MRIDEAVGKLLSLAGTEINGKNTWNIMVHSDDFYGRVISQGSLGFGEPYMDGWLDCQQLDGLFYRILSNCFVYR